MAKKKSKGIGQSEELNMALAMLVKNTRTTKRHLSVPDIAEWIRTAAKYLGSIANVADRIGLSAKMLRQFLAVDEVDPHVRKLFQSRELDSVDLAAHLRSLPPEEQRFVAECVVRKELNTSDVRAIVEFRKENPELHISQAVDRVKESKPIKLYVVEFVVRGDAVDEKIIGNRFVASLGYENIVSLRMQGALGVATISEAGRLRLRQVARKWAVSQAEAISKIARGDDK